MRYKKFKFKKNKSYGLFNNFILLPTGIILIYFCLVNIPVTSDIFSRIPNLTLEKLGFYFIVSVIIYFLYLVIIFYLWINNKKFYYSIKVKNNLNKIIENNGLYEIDIVDSQGFDGKMTKKEKVVYYPKILYLVENDYILIKFRLDGSRYENKFINLESKLSNIFRLKVVSELNMGDIEYKLLIKEYKPLFFDETIEGQKLSYVTNEKLFFTDDISWNFRKQPHALITGATGGGKSYLLYWIIRNLLSIGAELKVIDPKVSALDYLKNIINPSDVASSKGNIIRILREGSELINKRNIAFQDREDYKQNKDYLDYGYKPVFIVFDEVIAFFASCDNKEVKEANNYLLEIIMKGRSAGVFIIMTTQRADADVISGKIRDQLSLRVSVGKLSSDGYQMTFGNEYKDLRLTMKGYSDKDPTAGVGYIFIEGALSKPQEFYSPFFKDAYDFFRDVKELYNN